MSVTLEDILAVARERCLEAIRHEEGKGGGGREVTESDAGSDGPWYYGTETGDARVGKLSCVGTRRLARERGKGDERVAPPADIGWRAERAERK